jgi:hypothetical protein
MPPRINPLKRQSLCANVDEKKEEKQVIEASKKESQKTGKSLKDEEEKPKRTKKNSTKEGLGI